MSRMSNHHRHSPLQQKDSRWLCLYRELTFLRQHPGDLLFTFVAPLLLIVLVIWIFSSGSFHQLPIAVVDHDQSQASHTLIQNLNALPDLDIRLQTADPEVAKQALTRRQVYAVLIFPERTEQSIYRQESADLILYINSQYTSYAATIERAISTLVYGANLSIASTTLQSQSGAQQLAMTQEQSLTLLRPIQVTTMPLYNESPNYAVFLSATLIPALLHIFAVVFAVSSVGRELRDGTAHTWLHSAQGSLARALTLKLLPYFVSLAFFSALYIGYYAWSDPAHFGHQLWSTYFTLMLMNGAAMAIGLLFIAITRNFRFALSVAGFYSAPAFAFSGQAFPLVAMPISAQYWASILPLTHWLKIYNSLWLAQAPLASVQTPLMILVLMCLCAVPAFFLLQRYAFQATSWGHR